MSLSIVRYHYRYTTEWGLLQGRDIRQIPGRYETTAEFLRNGVERARKLSRSRGGTRLSVEKVQILSPVTAPCQIVCQGKNYTDHIRETGFRPEDKDFNLFFQKAASSLCGARGNILRPGHVQLLDYEIELGLVLGNPLRAGDRVTADTLHDCVAGLVVANDVSARDVQVPQGQWFKGKSYRSFCPVGPYLVLLEKNEFAYLNQLQLALRVNGEIRQEASVAQMIYSPAETLQELAGLMDLEPGDLVLTGTPAGVAMRVPGGLQKKLAQLVFSERGLMGAFVAAQLKSARYLNDGDVVHASIRTAGGEIDLGMQEMVVRPASG